MAVDEAAPISVLVFARAPVAGQAKTRLIPAFGPAGAAAFQAALTLRALEAACQAGLGPVRLCGAPDAGHAFFSDCRDRLPIALHDQHGADLGERMHHALAAALETAAGAILIGTDIPLIDAGYLTRAAAVLRAGHEAVFGPVEDGGYGLVGLRRPRPALFADIAWGSDAVWATTRQRLATAGIDWQALPALRDIDEPADLAELARTAPAVAARLDSERHRLARSVTEARNEA